MNNIKLTPFVLGMIFTVNTFAQAVTGTGVNISAESAVSVAVVTQPVYVPPIPLKNQILSNRSQSVLLNHPLLNKITELLMLADLEGMQRDWFVNEEKVHALNLMAQTNNMTEMRNQAGIIAKNILTALNRGYITPDRLGDKTNIKTKKVASQVMQAQLVNYANGFITALDLFNTFRPKNANYTKLLAMYRKFTMLKQAGQIMPTPAKLGVIKPGSLDQASILFARQRLAMFGYANDVGNPEYSEDLNMAIRGLQENNLLRGDGVIGKNSWGLLNTPIDQIITRLKINLDRSRWLPDALQAEFVHINLAAQRLFYYKDNIITLTFRTINGRVERPTPIMIDAINHMRLNPTWTVPRTIYFQDKGKLFAYDPQHAIDYRYRFYDLSTVPLTEVQVTDINWLEETSKERELSNAGMNYRIVQAPGPNNALGWIKFPLMRNSLSIYMHDTNERNKFAQTNRMLSSGCIRMEKPFELAEKLLSGQTDPMTGFPVHTVDTLKAETEGLVPLAETETVRQLGRTVPVYVLYETTQIDDHGQMTLVPDPYGVDMDMYNMMMGLPTQAQVLQQQKAAAEAAAAAAASAEAVPTPIQTTGM